MVTLIDLVGSALFGSILTTLLTKLIESREKKKEFDRDLRKTFFVSKLKTAEEIYAQLTIVLGSLHHTIMLFKIERDDIGKTDDFKQLTKSNLIERINKAKEKIDGTVNNTAFAYGLYFGNNNDAEFLAVSERIHAYLSEMQAVIDPLLKTIYPDETTNVSLQGQNVACEQAIAEYQKEMNKIIDLYEQMKVLIHGRLKNLRDHYQKLNPIHSS
jgi:hypothetical protein